MNKNLDSFIDRKMCKIYSDMPSAHIWGLVPPKKVRCLALLFDCCFCNQELTYIEYRKSLSDEKEHFAVIVRRN